MYIHQDRASTQNFNELVHPLHPQIVVAVMIRYYWHVRTEWTVSEHTLFLILRTSSEVTDVESVHLAEFEC